VAYVFGNLDRVPPDLSASDMLLKWVLSWIGVHHKERRRNSVDDRHMSQTLQDAWIAFAATGNPGGGWPAYDGAALMSFSNHGTVAGPDPLQARLDYVDQNYPQALR